ncbi:endoglucanase D precursor [mine drainage metagenome]|uniref:Endoglucanase D n=1 Tax=mine drainage metagenome TaxID=410659 RepID=A0A1J5S1B6_9ZZZZ
MPLSAFRLSFGLLSVLALGAMLQAATPVNPIRLDTIGYLPESRKEASVDGTCRSFRIIDSNTGSEVYSGTATRRVTDADTHETLTIVDFSALTRPGQYRLEIPGVGRSAPFLIGDDVYRAPYYLVTRAMYLWRCGTEVSETYEGVTFHQSACHLNDAWTDYINGRHERIDATGGWHDAGDYNKYVVNAGISVGSMLRAWEDFGPRIAEVQMNLPESGGPIPDLLAEVKWETDWLLKMQAPDGSVYHKISALHFCPFIMPAQETGPRYFVPWSSEATADFVAVMAQMSRDIRPYDAVYADRCLAAARKSYTFLLAHPAEHHSEQSQFHTGAYDTGDADERLWAAAELWDTTGDAAVLRDLETRIRTAKAVVEPRWDWGDVQNLGSFTYVLSTRPGRDPSLVAEVRRHIVAAADQIVATARADGYNRPLGSIYYWGGNGCVARQTMNLEIAYRLTGDKDYRATMLDALHYLFGRNVNGRSYVTGLGFEPPMHPHDRRSASDGIVPPWPGYLVGGPNPGPADWHDDERDYRTNEIAINWNTALIYALAAQLPR